MFTIFTPRSLSSSICAAHKYCFQRQRPKAPYQGANNTDQGMQEARGRRGYVPVLVGKGKLEDMEKIWVTIKAIQHLTIVELLQQSADEHGYQQGLLRIIYDANTFKAMLHNMSKK